MADIELATIQNTQGAINTAYVGGATDNVKVDDEGIELQGTATVYDDIRIIPNSLPLIGANPPEHKIIANDGTATTGTAGEFNGSSSKGEVPDYSALDVTSMSVAMWINADSAQNRELMDRDMSGGLDRDWETRL